MTRRPQHLEVVVDHLVLDGVAPEDAPALVAAFEAHLHDLATGTPTTLRPTGRELSGPAALGRHTAEQVWQQVGSARTVGAP